MIFKLPSIPKQAEFVFNYVLLSLALLFTYCFVYPAIDPFFFKMIILLNIDKIGSYWYYDMFFTIVLLGCIWYKSAYHWRETVIHFNDFKICGVILSIYLMHRLNITKQTWEFLSLTTFSFLKYADLFILILLCSIFSPSKRVPLLFDKRKLLEDDAENVLGEDVLRRDNHAQRLAHLILENSVKKSFAVAVTGTWGAGKSTFIRKVQDALSDKVVTITFNPWLSQGQGAIVEQFGEVLFEKIRPYNKNLSDKIRNYSREIESIETKVGYKFGKYVGLSNDDGYLSLMARRERIRDRLETLKLKIVVFIDDLDRLEKDEIAKVLSFIRNSFEFPNVFFVVAYDFEYVSQELGKIFSKPDQYLEKIFQMDIDLPTYPNHVLLPSILKLIIDENGLRNDVSLVLKDIILDVQPKSIFRNFRDCIRFANSVNFAYIPIKDQVDLKDFVVLELIKTRNKGLHETVKRITNNQIEAKWLFVTHGSDFSYYEFISNDFLDVYKDSPNMVDYVKYLSILFDGKKRNVKSLSVTSNHIRYFGSDLFESINFNEFFLYKKADEPELFANFVSKTIVNGDGAELIRLMKMMVVFDSKVELINFTLGALMVSNKTGSFDLPFYLVSLWKTNFRNYLSGPVINFEWSRYKIFRTYPFVAETFFLNEFVGAKGELEVPNFFIRNRGDVITLLNSNILHFFKSEYKNDNQWTNHLNRLRHKNISDEEILIIKCFFKENWSEVQKHLTFEIFIGSAGWEQLSKFFSIDELLHLINPTAENFLKLRIKSLLQQQKYGRVAQHYVIQILSDFTTSYVTDRGRSFSIERDDQHKLDISNKYPALNGAFWINHADITFDEQVSGGIYYFEKEFDLQNNYEALISGKIFLLADDEVELTINSVSFGITLYGHNRSPHEINIASFLKNGMNLIGFHVKNASLDANTVRQSDIGNPYGFIYNIELEFRP